MNTLSESFGAEIRQFPDNYFLTFEMYDLLHDWFDFIFLLIFYFIKNGQPIDIA